MVASKVKTLSATAKMFQLEPDIMTLGGTKQDRKTAYKTRQDQFTIPGMNQDIMDMSAMDKATAAGMKTGQMSAMKMDTLSDLDFGGDFFRFDTPSPKTPRTTSFTTVPSKGFPFFRFPKKLGGAGGDDFGFGFTTPISRKRKHKTGDILAELDKLTKGFSF